MLDRDKSRMRSKIEICIHYHAEDYDNIKDAKITKILGIRSYLGGCDIFRKDRYMFFIIDKKDYRDIEKKLKALDAEICISDDMEPFID